MQLYELIKFILSSKIQNQNRKKHKCLSHIYFQGFRNTTVYSREATDGATTEWPWPWHPDIHWYHQYLNLSLETPEIWHALYLGVLTQVRVRNTSHAAFKWVAIVTPNFTAINKLYREQYKGRDRNMTICVPVVFGVPYPDYYTRDEIFGCVNYVPESIAHIYHLKDMKYLYNRDKPVVDVMIGLGTIVTVLGVPGKQHLIAFWV